MRILAGTTAPITLELLDYLGEPQASPSPTSVAVAATAASGATVTTSNLAGLTVDLQAPPGPDLISLVWDVDGASYTDFVEVVGGFIFSVAEARRIDNSLADSGRYPFEDIAAARLHVEAEAERIMGRSMSPRLGSETLVVKGNAGVVLIAPDIREVVSVSKDGVEVTSSVHVANAEAGILSAPPEWEGEELVVTYRYGLTVAPEDVKVLAVRRLRWWLTREVSGVSDRAATFSTEGGATYGLLTASATSTGDHEVDAVYRRMSVDSHWGLR